MSCEAGKIKTEKRNGKKGEGTTRTVEVRGKSWYCHDIVNAP